MKKRYLALLLFLIFAGNVSFGFQIVYPKKQSVTINSDKTFFIGNEKKYKTLKINNTAVKLHPSGGFKHVVKLDYGQNVFIIDNGEQKQTFKINRPIPAKNSSTPPQQLKAIYYENPIVIITTKENVPLRSTPVDAGLNRLQHLPFGTEFIAIGEERGFYRVKLGRDGFGFISKDSAQKFDNSVISYANIQYSAHKSNKDEKLVEISLDKKVPYTVSDNNSGLDIALYNIDNHLYEKYEDHIVGKPFGYSSYYNNDGTLVISMKNFPKVNPQYLLKNLKITIDPGHGGSESGAIGCLGDKEKDINLEIAKNLRSKLEKAGAKVLMTREDDSYVGLNERVEKSNYFNADIFLSIHNNALPDSAADRDATGTEAYYFYPQSKELANILAKSVTDKTGFKNGGARGKSLAVVRNTQSIAVLLEVGYLINPDDNSKLINKDFQDNVTDGIIDGLERYLKQNGI